MIPDVQGDIVVDALRLLRRAGDALGELSRQRPQVGRKDDVGRFLAGVREIPGIALYGAFDQPVRSAIVSLNVGDIDSAEISDALMQGWGIATRPGAHCAPLMHRALGTERQGIVRFSFGYFNTDEEVDTAIDALRDLAC